MKPGLTVNILLVDDEESNLIALEATLAELGHNLVKATSGTDALRCLLEQDFAVILMDIQMAKMNGFETAEAIRERERSRRIPIIFLTGMVRADEMMFKGYSAGAVDFLLKPIRPNVLRAKVEVFCELALARLQLQEEVEQSVRVGAKISLLNKELEQKNADLREIVSELESYSYSISHDMRAPLRAMQGYADILLEEVHNLSDEHMGFLKRISSAARRLDHLIRDVLTYSQLSRAEIQLEPINLHRLISDITEQYPGLQFPEAEVKIIGELPVVMANEAILTQCVANLLGNAIKFVAPGNVAQVTISAEQERDDIVVSFQDNGIGIAPRDLDRIFNIFVKVHAPDTYPGTGIGLSIVKKSAERMKGQVGVDSKLGKGSRFWLRLKAAAEAKGIGQNP